MARADEPAWGERNAVTGYFPQYRISAALVIRGLREGSLRWIALADPKAGRVDDFQIATDQRVDGYQFKWSRYGGTVTFNDLIRVSEGSPSLIGQLADGWKRLRAMYPGRRAVVHLVTNQHPSTSDRQLPVGDPAPETKHFAAFVEQALSPAHAAPASTDVKVPAAWQTTWDALRRVSGLTEAEFREFILDCELEFGCGLPTTEHMSRLDAEFYDEDLKHVTHELFAAVYDPQHVVRLDRDALLSRLGWRDRFEYRNQHSFPVNEALYQPIEESKEALERALVTLDGGYVGVLGTPGSGKSTLLTQTLRYMPQRVIRYYAYIPDARGAATRGESVNFLHDVVRAIDEAGFKPGQSVNHPDRGQLLERLHEQLRLLSQDWQETGRKTIILVDGLDHIPREQRPTHSLLRDLPLPEQVPQGVFFVLGSQTDQLEDLPGAVQLAIRQPERRIELGHLSREAVRRVVERAGITGLLSEEQAEQVYQISDGHPLSLIYLLRQLELAGSEENVREILRNAEPYGGRIEEQYHSYWRQIDEDDELATLLGLIARMRGMIDLQWVESWSSAAVVRRLRRRFAHLFRIEDHDRWYFFHNSFRLFLSERTAHSTPGVFDPAADRALHHELASKCRQSGDARWQWEELYHLYKAEADDDLLQRARPELFRGQFLSFRSAEAIRADIVLAIQAAGRRRDVVSLVRLLLADAEMAQREANTDDLSLGPLLLALGEEHAALEHLRDGQRLRVSPEKALENSIELLACGLEREARQLFDLGEPLEHLSGAKEVERHDNGKERERLRMWAEAAVHFRAPDKVISATRQVRVEPDRFARRAEVAEDQSLRVVEVETDQTKAREEADEETQQLQNAMLLRAGLALLEQRRWEDLNEIDGALGEEGGGRADWWFALRTHCLRACLADGDLTRARQVLSGTIARLDRDPIGDGERVVIAESVWRLEGNAEKARLWLRGAQPIGLQQLPSYNFDFSVFNHLLRYARLLYVLGERRAPAELIPAPENPSQLGAAYFQRGVCIIAWLWALGWRGQKLDHATIRQETFPLLRLFYHSWRETRWDSWYWLTEIKGEFYEALIAAVSFHGAELVQCLTEEFAREWEGNSRYWSSKSIREIVLALHSAGADVEWVAEQLERVERMIRGDEVLPRIGEEVKQVSAWLTLGREDKARESLLRALLDSSSVGNKDYQLSEWIAWLRRANRFEPEKAFERVTWFAQAVADLERNGGPAKDAAYDLLEVVFEWSPRRAVRLFEWLLDHGLVYFEDAVRSLLRASLTSRTPPCKLAAIILTDFLLPLSDVDGRLIRLLVDGLYKQSGRAAAVEFVREFASAVEIQSLPSNRRGWRRALAKAVRDCGLELAEVGLSDADLEPEEDRGTDNSLRLADGTSLTFDEVRARASTVTGLRELMEQEGTTFYHWDEIIDDLASKLTDSTELMEVVDLSTRRFYPARPLGRLTERLLELGHVENARRVAKFALAWSEASGWAVPISGGTKITAFKVLTAIDGDSARESAFTQLVEDMTGAFRYPSYTVQNLDEILPLLTAEVPEKEVWAELEPHVHSLFPAVDKEGPNAELLASLRETPDADTPARALAHLLGLHVAHPINLLASSAQAALIRLSFEEEPLAQGIIRQLLRGSEREQECVLMVLDAVTTRSSDFASGFVDELRDLEGSPNFVVRIIAQRVGRRGGVTIPIRDPENAVSPSIYHISLPPGPDSEEVWRETITAPEDFLPETSDPYELLKVQLIEFEWLASQAGLAAENVIQRAAQIAREISQGDKWAALGEKQLRYRFDLAGLKYSYRRPRATIARRAFFHVATELVDAGIMSATAMAEMKHAFTYYDPEMFFIKPVSRPGFVFPMPGGRRRGNPIAEPQEDKEGLPRLNTDEGHVIFGEYTKIKRLEWEIPKVIRRSVIAVGGGGTPVERGPFFARTVSCLVEDYPTLGARKQPHLTVVHHEGRTYDSPGPEWLAFNPELARSLGWTPVSDPLFGWVDEQGKQMVWSLWWRDGLYEASPPKFEDDVGVGWAVLGTIEALARLRQEAGGQLTQYLRTEDSWLENKERKRRVKSANRFIDVPGGVAIERAHSD